MGVPPRRFQKNHAGGIEMKLRGPLIALGWMIAFGSCAQITRPIEFEGQPLIYTKDGVITGCGLRVLGAEQSPKKPLLLIDSSFQIDSRFYGVIAKFTARYGVMKDGVLSIKSTAIVERGWYRIDGMNPTKPKNGNYIATTEPTGGVFYVTNTAEDIQMLVAMLEGETIEMGMKLKGDPGEIIRFGKLNMSDPERMRTSSCIATLLKIFEDKLQTLENAEK
jgi:hypothetical protein